MQKKLDGTKSSDNSADKQPKLSRRARREIEAINQELIAKIQQLIKSYMDFALTHEDEETERHLKVLVGKYQSFIKAKDLNPKEFGNLFMQKLSETIQNNIEFRKDLEERDKETKDILDSLRG